MTDLYRVYSKATNSYISNDYTVVIDPSGQVYLISVKDYKIILTPEKSNTEIERFTGVVDSENTPIFEGDRIFAKNFSKRGGIVKLIGSDFCAEFTDANGATSSYTLFWLTRYDNVKIIGSVHKEVE